LCDRRFSFLTQKQSSKSQVKK